MNGSKCEICKYSKIGEPIYETRYWRVTIADDQKLLGRCYVSLKRHSGSLSDVSAAEWTDLRKVVKKLESAIKRAFGAKMFNWNCYMNNAYQVTPSYPHVHWHLRPRYDHPVIFGGQKFYDRDFGHAAKTTRRIASKQTQTMIAAGIRDKIKRGR